MKNLRGFLCLMMVISLFFVTRVLGSDYLIITEVGTSATTIGKGGIQGFDHTSNSIFENPATLVYTPKIGVSSFMTNLFGEYNIMAMSGSMETKFGTFGLGLVQGGVNGLSNTSVSGGFIQEDGTFSFQDLIFKLGYSTRLSPDLSMGVGCSYYQKSISTVSGTGVGCDYGIYYVGPLGDASVIVRNMFGGAVRYSSDVSEALPSQLVFSGRVPYEDYKLYGQCKLQTNKPLLTSFGVSSSVFGVPSLSWMAGYKQFWVLNKAQSCVTFGMTFTVAPLSIQYAFEPSNFVEQSGKHYLSFSTEIDTTSKSPLEILGVK